ncbi:hypothetical protein G6F24_016148 [Rhizopus arrhizus]|nr:hypothetical protein G6F24_016148 [Rhizopus arrhizus]
MGEEACFLVDAGRGVAAALPTVVEQAPARQIGALERAQVHQGWSFPLKLPIQDTFVTGTLCADGRRPCHHPLLQEAHVRLSQGAAPASAGACAVVPDAGLVAGLRAGKRTHPATGSEGHRLAHSPRQRRGAVAGDGDQP